MPIVDELVTVLGLEKDKGVDSTASSWGRMIGGIIGAAAKGGAAILALTAGVQASVAVQATAIDSQAKFAESMGLSYERAQELAYAVQATGGEVNEFQQDVLNLVKGMSNATTGELSDTFKSLGIQATDAGGKMRSTSDIIDEFAQKLEGMDRTKQVQLIDSLGLSPSTIKLLQQGKGGIAELATEARSLGIVMGEKSKYAAAAYTRSFMQLRGVTDGLSKTIAIGLMPALTATTQTFTKWISENTRWISLGIQQAVEGVGDAFALVGKGIDFAWQGIKRFLGPYVDFNKQIDISRPVMIAMVTALGLLAVGLVTAYAPVIAITAGIAALILVIDDIAAAIQGQPSLIGSWVKSFTDAYPRITDVIGKIADFWVAFAQGMWSTISAIVPAIIAVVAGLGNAIIDTIVALLDGTNPFAPLWRWLQDTDRQIRGLIGQLAEWISTIFGETFTKIIGKIGDLATKAKAFIGLGEDANASVTDTPATGTATPGSVSAAERLLNGTRSLIPGDPGGPAAGAFGGVQSVPVPAATMRQGGAGNVTNNVTQTINGAGDPGRVADEVVRRGGLGTAVQKSTPGTFGPGVG